MVDTKKNGVGPEKTKSKPKAPPSIMVSTLSNILSMFRKYNDYIVVIINMEIIILTKFIKS
jgi:hypothetical protein